MPSLLFFFALFTVILSVGMDFFPIAVAAIGFYLLIMSAVWEAPRNRLLSILRNKGATCTEAAVILKTNGSSESKALDLLLRQGVVARTTPGGMYYLDEGKYAELLKWQKKWTIVCSIGAVTLYLLITFWFYNR